MLGIEDTFRAFGFSFLGAVVMVWAYEIRAVGFRPWLRASMKQSFLQSLVAFNRDQWLRLFAFWAFYFVATMLIVALVDR